MSLPDSSPVTWLVLDRYLAGECTADEAAHVRTRLQASAAAGDELSALLDALGAEGEEPDRAAVRASFERLCAARPELRGGSSASVQLSPATPGQETFGSATSAMGHLVRQPRANRLGWLPSIGTRYTQQWLAAVSVVLAIGAGVTFFGHDAEAPRVADASLTEASTSQYTTTTGQRAIVTLRDGTRVTLAPRTTLRVVAFGARSRTVALDGEAYFAVARATGAPFIVRSGAAQARVLGTTFAVRHYPTDGDVRVAVTTGKVVVTPTNRPGVAVLLTPGLVGIVTDSTSVTDSNVARYTEWTEGRLVFRGAPLDEVLATLSRWYGYEFRLADSTLLTGRLTASLSTNSSAQALATLKLFLDVDLVFQGNVITLTPRSARPHATPALRGRYDTLVTPNKEVGR